MAISEREISDSQQQLPRSGETTISREVFQMPEQARGVHAQETFRIQNSNSMTDFGNLTIVDNKPNANVLAASDSNPWAGLPSGPPVIDGSIGTPPAPFGQGDPFPDRGKAAGPGEIQVKGVSSVVNSIEQQGVDPPGDPFNRKGSVTGPMPEIWERLPNGVFQSLQQAYDPALQGSIYKKNADGSVSVDESIAFDPYSEYHASASIYNPDGSAPADTQLYYRATDGNLKPLPGTITAEAAPNDGNHPTGYWYDLKYDVPKDMAFVRQEFTAGDGTAADLPKILEKVMVDGQILSWREAQPYLYGRTIGGDGTQPAQTPSGTPDTVPVTGTPDTVPITGTPDTVPVTGTPDTVPITGTPDTGPIAGTPDTGSSYPGADGYPNTQPIGWDGGQSPCNGWSQDMNIMMRAFQEAWQQCGGDPSAFIQDFIADLQAELQNAGRRPIGDYGGNPFIPPSDTGNPSSNPIVSPGDSGSPTTNPTTNPVNNPIASDTPPAPQAGGGGGRDMTSLFTRGDSGVTSAEMQHAIDIANAFPDDMKQALLSGHAKITLNSGFMNGLAQGQNNGTDGQCYVDSGMFSQALTHELYEMAGQIDPSLPGTWGDAQAVGLADAALRRGLPAGNPGDLNDTVGQVQGDGDLLSNIFAADFFAAHPNLNQDTVNLGVLQSSVLNAPQLSSYIAQAQSLTDASTAFA